MFLLPVTEGIAHSASLVSAAPVTPWPQFHLDATHRGWDTAETILSRSNVSQLQVKWSMSPANGFSPPVVANGILYVTTFDSLEAFDASNGLPVWTFVPSVVVARISMPVVANGEVFIAVNIPNHPFKPCKGVVYAVDAATGVMTWQARSGCSNSTSMTVAPSLLIAGSSFDVNAFSPSTGHLLWTFPTGGSIESTPAVAAGVVYVSSDDGNLYAIDASTGLELWSYPIGGGPSSPAVAGGVVYIGSLDGHLNALDVVTGLLNWSFPTGSLIVSSPSIAAGLVYFGAQNGNVYALRASDGGMRWTFPTGFSNVGAFDPSIANAVVYVGADSGTFYALNSSTGQQIWSFVTPDVAAPAVADGNIYATSVDYFGTTVVYDFGLPG